MCTIIKNKAFDPSFTGSVILYYTGSTHCHYHVFSNTALLYTSVVVVVRAVCDVATRRALALFPGYPVV